MQNSFTYFHNEFNTHLDMMWISISIPIYIIVFVIFLAPRWLHYCHCFIISILSYCPLYFVACGATFLDFYSPTNTKSGFAYSCFGDDGFSQLSSWKVKTMWIWKKMHTWWTLVHDSSYILFICFGSTMLMAFGEPC